MCAIVCAFERRKERGRRRLRRAEAVRLADHIYICVFISYGYMSVCFKKREKRGREAEAACSPKQSGLANLCVVVVVVMCV